MQNQRRYALRDHQRIRHPAQVYKKGGFRRLFNFLHSIPHVIPEQLAEIDRVVIAQFAVRIIRVCAGQENVICRE